MVALTRQPCFIANVSEDVAVVDRILTEECRGKLSVLSKLLGTEWPAVVPGVVASCFLDPFPLLGSSFVVALAFVVLEFVVLHRRLIFVLDFWSFETILPLVGGFIIC